MPQATRDESDAKARTTLWIIGVVLLLAVAVMALFSTYLRDAGPVGPWITLGCAALAGACVGRLHWISHYAFRTKTFDPLLIPHHYAWIVAGAAVVVALLALPASQTQLLAVGAAPTLALAFALGVFSEETWDALHGRIRALFGKAPRLDPALPDVDGIDVPLDALKTLTIENASAHDVVVALRSHGIRYSHQLVAMEKAGHLPRLAEKTKLPESALRALARLGDELRDPAAVARLAAPGLGQNIAVQPRKP